MEQKARTFGLLHRKYGYTWNGEAPIGGLTPIEFNFLILDSLMQAEAFEHQGDVAMRQVPHSKGRSDTRQLAQQIDKRELN